MLDWIEKVDIHVNWVVDLNLMDWNDIDVEIVMKPNCCNRLRTRKERTTSKRAGINLTADKESKLTSIKTNIKNGNHHLQRDVEIECQL